MARFIKGIRVFWYRSRDRVNDNVPALVDLARTKFEAQNVGYIRTNQTENKVQIINN
jgi:hypothetical protein